MTTPDLDPNEQIAMRHADSGPIGSATRRAFDVLWAPKGWQEVSAAEVEAAADAPVVAPAKTTGSRKN